MDKPRPIKTWPKGTLDQNELESQAKLIRDIIAGKVKGEKVA